jgi:DNA-binding NarL/FixJ family response regulator
LEPSRILLVDLPGWRQEIVAKILAEQIDLVAVGSVSAATESLTALIKAQHVDVVVIGRDDPIAASLILERAPCVKVLAVTGSDDQAWLYELRPHRIPLGEVSAVELVEAIRSAARARHV